MLLILILIGHGEVFNWADSEDSGPIAIIANTTKGRGVSFMEDTPEFHGKAPDDEELERALEELAWAALLLRKINGAKKHLFTVIQKKVKDWFGKPFAINTHKEEVFCVLAIFV